MQYRPLGATGIEVSVIGFGCNRIGWRSDGRADVDSTIGRAVESGITFFDTANSCTRGDSERVLGRALRGRRHRVVLCTKAGHAYWGSLP
jgi:aryl-alcohol dehydrogenase-like predicted oxidoreductase